MYNTLLYAIVPYNFKFSNNNFHSSKKQNMMIAFSNQAKVFHMRKLLEGKGKSPRELKPQVESKLSS